MDSTEEPSTLFDLAAQVCVDAGQSLEEARDRVILHCLAGGNTEAFVYFETMGHLPSREVLRMLSMMMTPSEKTNSEKLKSLAPFTLVTKRRNGRAGRHKDPLVSLRDQVLYLNVVAQMEHDLSLDAAAAAVAMLVSEKAMIKQGRSLKTETVLAAYKRYHRGAGK